MKIFGGKFWKENLCKDLFDETMKENFEISLG